MPSSSGAGAVGDAAPMAIGGSELRSGAVPVEQYARIVKTINSKDHICRDVVRYWRFVLPILDPPGRFHVKLPIGLSPVFPG